MNLNRLKVIEMVKERMVRIEKDHAKSLTDWDDSVVEYYENKVENAVKELAEAKAKLVQVKKPSYNADLDEEIAYSLEKRKPGELPEIHNRLKELVDVLKAVSDDEIKVSPQIERALGLKW